MGAPLTSVAVVTLATLGLGCAGGPAISRPGGTMAIVRPSPGAPLHERLRTGTVLGDLRKREAPGTLVEPIDPPELEDLDSGVALVSYDTTSLCLAIDDHQPATTRTRMLNPYERLEAQLETSDGLVVKLPKRTKLREEPVTVRVAVGAARKEVETAYLRLEAQLCFVTTQPILTDATTWVRLAAKLGDTWQRYTWTLDGVAAPEGTPPAGAGDAN